MTKEQITRFLALREALQEEIAEVAHDLAILYARAQGATIAHPKGHYHFVEIDERQVTTEYDDSYGDRDYLTFPTCLLWDLEERAALAQKAADHVRLKIEREAAAQLRKEEETRQRELQLLADLKARYETGDGPCPK